MTFRVIAVKNAKVSRDLEHINACVLHQTLMIWRSCSHNLMQKTNQKPTMEMNNQHHPNQKKFQWNKT